MRVKQHRNVLVSCFQSDGQSIALVLRKKRQQNRLMVESGGI